MTNESTPRLETVFDPIRRKRVAATPEEGVRQAMLEHLMTSMRIPEALIAVERGIHVSGRTLRPDIIVFDRAGSPWMIIECKAPGIRLTQASVNQVAAYHRGLEALYLLVTNGSDHICVRMNRIPVQFLDEFPVWPHNDQGIEP